MNLLKRISGYIGMAIALFSASACATTKHQEIVAKKLVNKKLNVQLGARPYYLVDDLEVSGLKRKLSHCAERKTRFKKTDFSIGHRGAPMQFPEHTEESYIAAARMGAGILECDVTFTNDRKLVCRHSQCDLHTTTNILQTPLASKCSIPFSPATFDVDGNLIAPAQAKCCTSDISLEEFKSLRGKMDASNPQAKNVDEYVGGTADWRTDLYTQNGTLLSHAESIELFKSLKVKMTPELKSPAVSMPFEGSYTQQDYAQQMINEYRDAGVHPRKVFPQSFNLEDVLYWIDNDPRFGKQAVFLDDRYNDPNFDFRNPSTYRPSMETLKDDGVKIIAPPMWMLIDLDHNNQIIPSVYANQAKEAGLEIITWTLERSGPLASGGGWYYQSVSSAIDNDGDMLEVLDVLAKDIGVKGVFSDWPATVSFYANCNRLK